MMQGIRPEKEAKILAGWAQETGTHASAAG